MWLLLDDGDGFIISYERTGYWQAILEETQDPLELLGLHCIKVALNTLLRQAEKEGRDSPLWEEVCKAREQTSIGAEIRRKHGQSIAYKALDIFPQLLPYICHGRGWTRK